jgi:hypothetical protein
MGSPVLTAGPFIVAEPDVLPHTITLGLGLSRSLFIHVVE